MSEKKKAKYFCENCGAEVASNARFCPKCGKFFSSVRCPQCGFTGDVKTFINGCPQCGYAMTPIGTDTKKDKKKAKEQTSEDAPAWLFILCIIILIIIVSIILFKCNA